MNKPESVTPTQSSTCNVCHDQSMGTVVFLIDDFQFVRCPRCAVLRVNPRLDDQALQAYYDHAYWTSQDSVVRGYFDYTADVDNIRRTFRRRLKGLSKAAQQKGRWLDVGCAAGYLVQETMNAGWDSAGIEWSDYIIQQADEAVRPRITQGRLIDADTSKRFDVITLWDYLEHSPHPRTDVEKAVALLNPGGVLSIIIPNAGSGLAKLMGSRWEEYKKPQEHLYFFTAKQLAKMCQQLGLRIEKKTTAGKYASLQFALSRFKPGDGFFYWAARIAALLLKGLGRLNQVVYINPYDKFHLVCRKSESK